MNARAEALDRLDAADWSALNQRWLAAELARLRDDLEQRRRDAGSRPAAAVPGPWAGDPATPPALTRLARLFALTGFERELLLLVAGLELDRGLRALLPQGVSFAEAMGLLPGAHWDALSPQAALRHWMLVEPAGASPLHAPLAIDERVLHALTGVGALDEKLRAWVTLEGGDRVRHAEPAATAAIAQALAQAAAGPPPVIAITGIDAMAGAEVMRRDSAVAAAARCGLQALLVSMDDLPVEAAEAESFARRLDREAALAQAAVVLWHDGHGEPGAETQRHALALLARLRSTVLLAAPLPPVALREHLARPLQLIALPEPAQAEANVAPETRRALQQFRVAPAVLRGLLAERGTPDDGCALWDALRRASRGGLDALAERIDSETRFDDLVLPAATAEQLREIAAQLAHRHTVYEDWGFARRGRRGLGIAALFAGDSGTGKTMAAEAIANEASLDLYRIDLAATVSKYIGETEKNLKRLFDAAEASGAVLLFDEADALFGKRSEVKDSHDRYANIEVAYLLQRIENYRGLAILTTNLKSALDKSFLRRLRFVVQFPFPDEAARERLWRAQLPPSAPVASVDFGTLARAQLSGGHIRAAALNAAFAAAARSAPIDDALLARAVRAEFAKLERAWSPGGQP
jgi:hypothetical protein